MLCLLHGRSYRANICTVYESIRSAHKHADNSTTYSGANVDTVHSGPFTASNVSANDDRKR